MWSTASQPVFRRFVGAVGAGMALAATSGCTVAIDAVTGISVTADGHLVGVIMVCGHRIDGASLYVNNADAGRSTTIGSWTADRPLPVGLTTWTLDSPAAGWTADGPPAPLNATTTYVLYGWTKDNSRSARSISFTLADQEQLTPGNVRYNDFTDKGEETTTTVSMTEFETRACQGVQG